MTLAAARDNSSATVANIMDNGSPGTGSHHVGTQDSQELKTLGLVPPCASSSAVQQEASDQAWRWIYLVALGSASFFCMLNMSIPLTFVPIFFSQELRYVSLSFLGPVFSGVAIGVILSAFAVNTWLKRYGRLRCLSVGLVVNSVAVMLFGLAPVMFLSNAS